MDPSRYLFEFATFFADVAKECRDNSLRIAAQMVDLQIAHRDMAVMAITLSGNRHEVEMFMERWGDFLWERGPLFARRNPSAPLHVPLSLPFDNPMLDFFPFVRHVVPWFNPLMWAHTACAPFTTYYDTRNRIVLASATTDDHDAASIHAP